MSAIIPKNCPKCNNSHNFYRFGKDISGNQKYQCRECKHQFTLSSLPPTKKRSYPPCPVCGKASFLHHDYPTHSNFRCGDKKCYHSFFLAKSIVLPPSVGSLFGKSDLKRMRHGANIIFTVLSMYFFGKDIPNNLIESFNKTFKAWYKTKCGFDSLSSAQSLITVFVFFYNFLRPHGSLSDLTPAQVAGLNYNPTPKNLFARSSYQIRGK